MFSHFVGCVFIWYRVHIVVFNLLLQQFTYFISKCVPCTHYTHCTRTLNNGYNFDAFAKIRKSYFCLVFFLLGLGADRLEVRGDFWLLANRSRHPINNNSRLYIVFPNTFLSSFVEFLCFLSILAAAKSSSHCCSNCIAFKWYIHTNLYTKCANWQTNLIVIG